MNVSVHIPQQLERFLGCLGPAGRHNLFSVAANALKICVREHIMRIAPSRHMTANDLGARATGHLTRGARLITHSADADHGEVVIPIPGISRALHDVVITPNASSALTLPLHQAAYGHRVAELQRMGWTVFRQETDDGECVLMGHERGKDDVVALYALKTRVKQEQDRSLLPSDAMIGSTAARAMIAELERVNRKAS